ncbi:Urokinase-type plasminogen activator [Smittium culicis]|uniref:Urokinase-type plasminogen activator n=1 Tax=Smittium culicis TaxID=133412 RepID=A0A1R1Y9Y4_9FUNG|nr:Urokinase-type plasminogen activator [Smittium culicis]
MLIATLKVASSKNAYTIYPDSNITNNQTQILPMIVNGVTTGTDIYPFISQLYYSGDKGSSYSFSCTASLIADQYVVSAAHCIFNDDGTMKPANTTSFFIGSANVATGSDISSFYTVTNIYTTGFEKDISNDIAIFKLNKKVPSSVATPVKVYPYKITTKLPVEVAGFGSSYSFGPLSKVLQRAIISVASDTRCSSNNSGWANNSGPLVCSISSSGNDSCNGDSGGPMVAKLNGKRTLVGIVSWGKNMDPKSDQSCGENTVAYYARAAYFVKWIASVIGVEYTSLIELVL